MSAWWAALRIARREALRAKTRAALVIAMIALPVAALTGIASAYDMFDLRTPEKLDRSIGAADASLQVVGKDPIEQEPSGDGYWPANDTGQVQPSLIGNGGTPPVDVAALLPSGTRLLGELDLDVTVRTPRGLAGITGRATDVGDPLQSGRVTILRGTAPRDATEIALTESAAEWLEVGLGGTVTATKPAQTFKVSAIIEYPADLSPAMVVHTSLANGAFQRWLADTPQPVTWEQVRQLNAKGLLVVSREVALNPPAIYNQGGGPRVDGGELALGGLVAALAIFEIVLLTGPAFAVGARRRNRELALIAAAGGEPKHIRRVVLADGIVLGLVGAVAGIVLGILVITLALPILEDVSRSRVGGWRVFPSALIFITVAAVGTGLLAATVPAFIAARQNLVSALNGRRGIVKSRKRWIVTGAVLGGSGATLALVGATIVDEIMVVIGLGIMEIGQVLLTPALIGLAAKAGRWLPLAPRLALRDMARNRTSAGPAVAAVMAAVAGAVATGTVLWSTEQQWLSTYNPTLPPGSVSITSYVTTPDEQILGQAKQIATQVYPGATIRSVSQATCESNSQPCMVSLELPPELRCPYLSEYEMTAELRRQARADTRCATKFMFSRNEAVGTIVDDGSTLDVTTSLSEADRAKATAFLAASGVIIDDARYVKDGKVLLSIGDSVREVPAMALDTGLGGASAIVSRGALAGSDVTIQPDRLVIKPLTPATADQEAQLRERLSVLGEGISPYTERGPRRDIDVVALLLAIGAVVIAVGAAGIATGLAAADARADLATLAAVGAAPAVRRRLTVSSAGLIAGMGALLGTLTGLIIALTLIVTINAFDAEKIIWPVAPPIPFTVPASNMLIVLVVPVIAMAGTALFTRARLPIERRI
ncbi:FtsX-like permease family protein [Catelliglobosispora koreensis]|uniref:FtsX-like permease family protein n=1 Tax=Catelliglobosispora koreensis TaxID=129052 RepID=UPI00035E52CB|nr:FtsX-like permease family protein [Catelliglobosispora koreensis]